MRIVFAVSFASVALLGCEEPLITIVDTGLNNRIEIGKQLAIIRSYSPKVIALDVLFTTDSSSVDSILVQELSKSVNSVQAVRLLSFNEMTNAFDSLQATHAKFKVAHLGFANLTTIADSVLFHEQQVRLMYRNTPLFAFSYIVAENSFGVKPKYRYPNATALPVPSNEIGRHYKLIKSSDLFTGNFNSRDLQGRIVLVGYVGDMVDYFYTDIRKTKKINGVEVHAALIDEIVDR